MATRRDVILGVDVETSGDDAIRRLASDFRALAKEGNDAAPEFARLAGELDRLAAQAAELKSFKALGADVEALSSKQAQAARVAAELAVQYDEQSSAVARLKEAQAQAAGAVETARAALRAAQSDLTKYRSDADAASKKTADFSNEQKRLKSVVEDAKSALLEKRQALAAVAQEAGAAERIERAIATEYTRSAEAAVSSTSALRERSAALQQSQQALTALGADTAALAGAEQRLTAALREVVSAGSAAQTSAEMLAAAQRLAAQAAQEQAQWARAQAQAAVVSEQAALRESEAFEKEYLAAQALVSKRREQQEADRLAAIQSRGLADAMDKARAAAAAELAAIRDTDRFVTQYAEDAKRAALATVQFAEGGTKFNEAFGVVGVRSLTAIEAEIRKVEVAMAAMERSYAKGGLSGAEFSRYTDAAKVKLQQLIAEAANVPKVAGVFEQMNTHVMGLINRFGALGAAAATLGTVVRPVVEATVQLDQMRRALTTVTGSSTEAAKQIEFLRNVAQRAGASVGEVGTAYSRFVASAATAGISMKTVQNVFESVAVAAGNLGLTSEQTKGALEALSQMASKGVVSMEELRQQLGDRLPAALSLMAQGLGLTLPQLNKLVETGGLLAEDALPAFAEALKKLGPEGGKSVSGLVAEWGRLKNVIAETTTVITDGAIGKALGVVLQGASWLVQGLSLNVAAMGEMFTTVGQKIGAAFGLVVDRDLKRFREEIARIDSESNTRLKGLADRIFGVGDAAAGAAAPTRSLSVGVEAAGTAAASAATSVKALEVQVGASAGTAKAAAPAHAGLGTAVASTGTAAGGGAKSYAALSVALDKSEASAKLLSKTTDKLVEASKHEAEAIAGRVASSGDSVAATHAMVAAMSRQEEATRSAAKASNDYLLTLRESLRARVEYLTQEKDADGQAKYTKERIEAITQVLREKVQAQEAEVEKTAQVAAAARAAADESRLQAEELKDNSGRWEELAKNVDQARQSLQSVVRKFIEGKVPVEDLTAAQVKYAQSLRLARDAVNDYVAGIERQNKVASAEAQLKKAGLDLDLAVAKNQLAEAQRLGNATAIRQATIKVKEIELKIDRDRLEASRADAGATLDLIAAERAELERLQQLTPEKKNDLDVRELTAKAKKREAEAGIEGLKQKQRELDLLKGLVPELRAEAEARKKNAKEMSDENDELKKRNQLLNAPAPGVNPTAGALARDNTFKPKPSGLTVNKEGWVTDPEGGVQSMSLPTVAGVIDTLKGYGLTDAQAAGLAREFTDGNGNIPYINNPGVLRYGDKYSTLSQALQKAAQLVKQGVISPGLQWGGTTPGAAFGDGGATHGGMGSGAQSGTSAPVGGTTVKSQYQAALDAIESDPTHASQNYTRDRSGQVTVHITLNGINAADVNVASEADAQALIAFFRQVEQDAMRSGGGGG